MFWRLQLTLGLLSCPVLAKMATISTCLRLKIDFGEAFSTLARHEFIARFGNFTQASRAAIEG